MKEQAKEIYEQEMLAMGKVFTGFLIVIGSVLGMWFVSGILYVILK